MKTKTTIHNQHIICIPFLPSPSLSTVLQTLLLSLLSLAIVPPLLVTLVALWIGDSLNATLSPSTLTTLLDSLLHLGHLGNVLGTSELLLQQVQDLVAVGNKSLVDILEGRIG